jgi:amidase
MPDAELLFRPVDELAGLVRSGELSARELVGLSLERIDALDGEVGAFVDVFEDALQEAEGIRPGDERPFAGVPVAIKNNRGVAGRRLTFGSGFADGLTAPYDHNVVSRLKRAGFVVVGTTKLPEWGILPVSEPRALGPARNPWDLSRTPGGSSGGSAAAVAAGMVPVAHANDGGGSTRIPAACCGLVGLKPQRGRISLAPDAGEVFLVQDGVLTRTVRETAVLLDLLAGPEPGDSSWAPPPARPFAEQAGAEPRGLRIAATTKPALPGAAVDEAGARAVAETAALLRDLGHEVVEEDPPWGDDASVLQTFTASFGPAVSTQIAFLELVNGRPATAGDMEALSWHVYRASRETDSVQAALAALQLQGLARAIVQWTARFDALLTPALREAPLPIGTLDTDGPDPRATFARSGLFTPYTAISNVTGSPAVSLPLFAREEAEGAAGLPLGVQLVGRPAEEGALLALAAQLEAALPWHDRRAPVL